MAIYHCSANNVSRSSGRTATASAAYRAAEKIKDERTGIIHDYTKKNGVEHTEIVSNLGVPIDRAKLWNLAEQVEKRKDARTAKEFVIALPHELNPHDRKEIAIEFAQSLVNRYGCVADVAIHAPSSHSEDDRNHHAHILFTTRKVGLDQQGALIFNEKIDLELSNAKRKQLKLGSTDKEIKAIRENWAQIANNKLAQAGIAERIDHRSYKEQGNGKIAQIHETPQVTAMRRKGKETEISKQNDERKAYNRQIEQETQQDKEQRQQEIIVNAQSSIQARLDERAAQREQERQRAEQEKQRAERERQEQEKQQHKQRGIGFSR